jgi:dihydrofolate reductase
MRTITVLNHLSLDGVMQAPGGPDEDARDGFDQGGWAMAGNDEVGGKFLGARMTEGASQGGSLLLGRRTYEIFASYWPKQTDDNPYTEALNRAHKYVVSTTLTEPLPWANSTLLKGEAAGTVAQLKQEPGGDLLIMGSGELVGSLIRAGLIDRYMLMTHALILGRGHRMFPEDGDAVRLRLTDTQVTTTGVIIATYEHV